jgi:hypothetical protein
VNPWEFFAADREWMLVAAVIAAIIIGLAVLAISVRLVVTALQSLRDKNVRVGPVEITGSGEAKGQPGQPVAASNTADIAMAFDFAEYLMKLRDEEHAVEMGIAEERSETYDKIKREAREITRRHTADFTILMREMNLVHFRRMADDPDPARRDKALNMTLNGIPNMLTKALMEIYEINHFRLMSDAVYRETMRSHYGRIKRMVYDAMRQDWIHSEIAFDEFMSAMERNQEQGEAEFFSLMERFRGLALRKVKFDELVACRLAEKKTEVAGKIRAVRLYVREHGELPPEVYA